MPSFLTPSSNSEDNAPPLREFNPHHEPAGSGKGGQFARTAGGTARPPVKKVADVDEAVRLILKGEAVEVATVKEVNTLLTKLAAMATEAKRLGQAAPNYDLCNVSVPGTNLFCASIVKTKDHPEGYSRIQMPQLGGHPLPGTEAAKLPRNKWDPTEVDGAQAFMRDLIDRGIPVTDGKVPAASLKASQRELVGAKVAAMMLDTSFDPGNNPVFISRDGYVLDGHHRWAAVVGRDAEDGRLGDKPINVRRVDAPISELLGIAIDWSKNFGIAPSSGN